MFQLISFFMYSILFYKFALAGSELEALIQECMMKYPNAKAEDAIYLKDFGQLPDESNRDAKCVFHCVPNKMGIMDENGVVDKVKCREAYLKFDPNMDMTWFDANIDKCVEAGAADTDPCEKAYKYKKCMMKAMKQSM